MRLALAIQLLALAGITADGTHAATREDRPSIEMREVEGELVCTVRARDANANALLAELARLANYKLTGVEVLARCAPIEVELVDRPFTAVVHAVLGACGRRARVRADEVEILFDRFEGDDAHVAEELELASEVAYLRALRSFADHPAAAQAQFALGEIQERRGNAAAARGHYDLVAKGYPLSELVPQALLAAGQLFERDQQWSEAARRFSTLANLPRPHAWQALARLELARCLCYGGDAAQALFMLDGLDALFTPQTPLERQQRAYVRARAQVGAHQALAALRSLDEAQQLGSQAEFELEALELRARAFEPLGRSSDAARSWLCLAEKTHGAQREHAYQEAARIAHAQDDLVAVLFIARSAKVRGLTIDALEELAQEARTSLGLELDRSLEETLAQAEELCSARSFHEAVLMLGASIKAREGFDEASRTQLVLLYARALDGDQDSEAALAMLRSSAPTLRGLEHRKRIYLLAGELLENQGRFDEAIDAYGGRL